jgi:ethanolamine utilization protein EutN
VWDENGAGIGSLIAVSEGAEATQPFRPEMKAVDAYAAAIIDHVDMS